ncbi:elongation factor G [Streptomyces radicis]|uniref:GTP-binding protein n=1 Tax=Streptomyces radicis TaxID=1750517 RepID=A0A3A9W3U7_9ACTN|nr:TetM/TetW/TetO/TetS family tetracycline resistance ribosomal protection protein [Streptomyces radicis]RKN03894.1 GTP-binding protein [Streptomyces radicis]RKN14166.1 GTP-binding protein [Streptomyces radicis]
MPDPSTPLPRTTLNLGVLAHVDAGKTSLTERLLFDHGAIPELGSVDAGSTRTDSGDLERERGITIRSAVAAFATGDTQVNVVDTPGHPDFIAEVERALAVLDGAVLVLSAVEGVQAQTRVLMRSLRRLRLPTLLFVNKIDRMGARTDSLLADIRRHLAPGIVPLSAVRDPGTAHALAVPLPPGEAAAEALAEHDDALLARLVDGTPPGARELGAALAEQTAAGLVHPVFFGSALTGEGVAQLTEGIRTLLRPPTPDPHAPARGTVFAVERTGGGRKVAYVRLFAGTVRERERLTFHHPDGGRHRGRVTGLDVVTAPGATGVAGHVTGHVVGSLTAGGIARLSGLPGVRVGDRLGERSPSGGVRHFPPPGLETVVRPQQPGGEAALHAALTTLADEDPLIRTRHAGGGATSVLLYGAVQREVIGDRLRREFGVAAAFEPITPVLVERPLGTGESVWEFARHGPNDFWATVGLRVEPAPPGTGIAFTRDVEWGALPRAFHRAIEEAARRALHQGLYGWEVVDCAVTVTRIGYAAPLSTAADFRDVTPIVLHRALRAARVRVHEPCQRVELEVPPATSGAVTGLLAALGADIGASFERGGSWVLMADLPVRVSQELTAALPGLTHGEGALWSHPAPTRPVRGTPPRRERFDGNPLNMDEYLRFLADRSLAASRGVGGG